MDKQLNIKSAMSIAFLFFFISYSFGLLHRAVTFLVQSSLISFNFIFTNLFSILIAIIILTVIYRKISKNNSNVLKSIFESSFIRITAGFLIMITTGIGIMNWIPSFTTLIYNHYKNMPDSSLLYYQQYIKTFNEYFIIYVIRFFLNIAEFIIGYYLTYKYKSKQPSAPEAEEAIV